MPGVVYAGAHFQATRIVGRNSRSFAVRRGGPSEALSSEHKRWLRVVARCQRGSDEACVGTGLVETVEDDGREWETFRLDDGATKE
jgi:hypothetical protein